MMMVELPEPPGKIDRVLGFAAKLKSVTVNVSPTVRYTPPPVATRRTV